MNAPAPVVGRLPGYLQALESLLRQGITTVSSEELARRCGVGSAVLRRDLSHVGASGRRGVGYDCAQSAARLRVFMGLDRTRRIGIVGAGRLGSALADYAGIRTSGFELVAVFDVAAPVVGSVVGGVPVAHLDALADVAAERGLELLVIAVPGPQAQEVADLAVAAGVRGLLNFAPVVLSVPSGVHVQHVDLATELQVLAHYTAAAPAPVSVPAPVSAETVAISRESQ